MLLSRSKRGSNLFFDEEDAPVMLKPNRSNTSLSTNSSANRSLISLADRIVPLKRVSPVQSSPSPIPSYDDSIADDEVDSTSECTDSEYSGPPTKMPLLDTSSFSMMKNITSDIENKYRDLHSENMKLQKKMSDLEYEKDEMKTAKKNLERTLQEERKMHNIVKAKQQNAERSLLSKQKYAETLETKLQNMDNQLKREQSLKKQWKQKYKQVVQNVQRLIQIDACRQDNGPIIWFDGHDLSKLPKVTMKFLVEYVAEFAPFWEELGMVLDMENAVKAEQTQSITAKQKCLHVLQQWITLASASYPSLLDALSKLSQKPLAIKIEGNILKEISDSDSEEEEHDSEAEDDDSDN